jgi:hypothetical protein
MIKKIDPSRSPAILLLKSLQKVHSREPRHDDGLSRPNSGRQASPEQLYGRGQHLLAALVSMGALKPLAYINAG